MQERRHHNNTGYRQIKNGKTRDQIEVIGKKLGIPVRPSKNSLKKIIKQTLKSGALKDG